MQDQDQTPGTGQAYSLPQSIVALRKRKKIEIRDQPDADVRAALSTALGILDIPSLKLEADIAPVGKDQWRVAGQVRAKVVQSCVVTLNPVSEVVEETFDRRFTEDDRAVGSDLDFDPVADDPPELVTDCIDVGAIAAEALALGLNPYPRAPGATFDGAQATPPGAAPIRSADLKPFAGLAALRKSMEADDADD